jgi:uncharacterized membrane protein YhdT
MTIYKGPNIHHPQFLDRLIWRITGRLARDSRSRLLGGELSKCHSFHQKSRTDYPGIEPAPSRWELCKYGVKFTSQLQFSPYFLSDSKLKVHNLFHKEYVGLNKSWKQQLKRVYFCFNLLLLWLCAWLLLSSVTEKVGCVGNPSWFVFGRCPVLILARTATVLTDTFLWFSLILQRKFGYCTFDQAMLASLHTLTISYSLSFSLRHIEPEVLTAMLSKLWAGIAQSV